MRVVYYSMSTYCLMVTVHVICAASSQEEMVTGSERAETGSKEGDRARDHKKVKGMQRCQYLIPARLGSLDMRFLQSSMLTCHFGIIHENHVL